MRFKTRPYTHPDLGPGPCSHYAVWDTELDEVAAENGLLLIFSSVTGALACELANQKTQELNKKEVGQ